MTSKSPQREFTDQISWVLMMQAFLARSIRTYRTDSIVSVQFKSELEAEEFQKLMMARKTP